MFGLGHSGSAPEPFDALNGPRLAGPEGSHPLRSVRAEELVRSSDDWVSGSITLDGPAIVGVGITGAIKLSAVKSIEARSAGLRLAGLRLDETRQHREEHDSQGRVTSREDWVEARGKIFDDQTFVEPVVPATLAAGQVWEGRFMVPAPPLGPPSAHLGESIVAWALEVHWDVAWGSDLRLATFLPLAQNRDLMAAGVGRQGGQSLMQEVSVDEATIVVTSDLPAPAGSKLALRLTWPGAPDGRSGRVELHRQSNAPNGETGIVASETVDVAALREGAEVSLAVPDWAPPSFDGAGLENRYLVRVLVDRRFRADAAIERPIGII